MSFCYMVFGAPGTGKTTYAVKLARQATKKGIKVYTNFPCKDTYKLDSADIGIHSYEHSLCLIDEAGIDFNNRDWKSLPKTFLSYIKLHRHYDTSFVFFSQGWDDADKKIRTLCTNYYNLKKLACFTFCRRLSKKVGVDKETHQIIDEYFKIPILAHGVNVCFRPKYYKYFDSWEAPHLPLNKADVW